VLTIDPIRARADERGGVAPIDLRVETEFRAGRLPRALAAAATLAQR